MLFFVFLKNSLLLLLLKENLLGYYKKKITTLCGYIKIHGPQPSGATMLFYIEEALLEQEIDF